MLAAHRINMPGRKIWDVSSDQETGSVGLDKADLIIALNALLAYV